MIVITTYTFQLMGEQALKLAKDMKISTNEINKDLDFQTHVYEQLGCFQKQVLGVI